MTTPPLLRTPACTVRSPPACLLLIHQWAPPTLPSPLSPALSSLSLQSFPQPSSWPIVTTALTEPMVLGSLFWLMPADPCNLISHQFPFPPVHEPRRPSPIAFPIPLPAVPSPICSSCLPIVLRGALPQLPGPVQPFLAILSP